MTISDSEHNTDQSIIEHESECFTESCMTLQNYVEPDISIDQLLQEQNTAPHIPFPTIPSAPVNTFQPLEEQAFPTLYPNGRYGLGYDRTHTITDLKYFQNQLFNKDPRWRI